MVRSRSHVLGDACADRGGIAPGDQRVDEEIAAAVDEVRVGEAELAPLRGVGVDRQVRRERLARGLAGLLAPSACDAASCSIFGPCAARCTGARCRAGGAFASRSRIASR